MTTLTNEQCDEIIRGVYREQGRPAWLNMPIPPHDKRLVTSAYAAGFSEGHIKQLADRAVKAERDAARAALCGCVWRPGSEDREKGDRPFYACPHHQGLYCALDAARAALLELVDAHGKAGVSGPGPEMKTAVGWALDKARKIVEGK